MDKYDPEVQRIMTTYLIKYKTQIEKGRIYKSDVFKYIDTEITLLNRNREQSLEQPTLKEFYAILLQEGITTVRG